MVLPDSHRIPLTPWYLEHIPKSHIIFAYGTITLCG
jgi:hypothetical protein